MLLSPFSINGMKEGVMVKKIVACLYLFLFLIISNANALDEVDKIASETIKSFKNKNYEETCSYFYIPPYYNTEDIKIDKESISKVLNIFDQELGDLKRYAEINVSKMDNACLGAISGVGDSGFQEGVFSTKDNSNLYSKAYKAYFSKAKELYIYVFIFNQRGKFSVTQFGIAFPSETDESGFKKLVCLIDNVYCKEFRNKKQKILADRLISAENNDVEYILSTKEGQDIALILDYPGAPADLPPKLVLIDFPNKERSFIGERTYHLKATNGQEIALRFNLSKKGELNSVKIEPPYNKEKDREIFSVESKGGFIINVETSWNNGTLTFLKVGPEISPFSGISYIECNAQNSF